MAVDTLARPGRLRATASETLDPRRWQALWIVLLAAFMDILDATVVTLAIPFMRRDLGATYAEMQWVVASYQLAFAALLITGGRLGDIFGRKRLFVGGVIGFIVTSRWSAWRKARRCSSPPVPFRAPSRA
jgi:predicted MFS family arabinose efflux permease